MQFGVRVRRGKGEGGRWAPPFSCRSPTTKFLSHYNPLQQCVSTLWRTMSYLTTIISARQCGLRSGLKKAIEFSKATTGLSPGRHGATRRGDRPDFEIPPNDNSSEDKQVCSQEFGGIKKNSIEPNKHLCGSQYIGARYA